MTSVETEQEDDRSKQATRSSMLANRIVLLGASNLTLSLRLAIQQIQHCCGRPSEVLAAVGHGRSYGQSSQVLIRELPGIIESGLWSQLHSCQRTESRVEGLCFGGHARRYASATKRRLG